MDDEKTIDEQTAPEPKRTKRSPTKKIIIFIVLLLVVIGGGYYLSAQFSGSSTDDVISPNIEQRELTEEELARQQEAIDKAVAETVEKAGKHIILPENEVPIMATVTDAEALKAEQAFYANVWNGDRILIYSQNQQAIIYSPERDIIVNVGPVVVDNVEDGADSGDASDVSE